MTDTECGGTPAEILPARTDGLFDGNREEFSLPEIAVTRSLDERLAALVALGDGGTHGTGLMDGVAQRFDVQPAVYPRLHELEVDGTFTRHDRVQTKQYSIGDSTAASLLERAMYQHLVLGLFLRITLQRCNSR